MEEDRALERYIMIPGTKDCVAVVTTDGTCWYPLWDHTGTIFALTDAEGKIIGSRNFWSIGGLMHEENVPIALGYGGGLSFMGHFVSFLDGQAHMLAFQRAAAAPAPWPYQPSLRTQSPFFSPSIENMR